MSVLQNFKARWILKLNTANACSPSFAASAGALSAEALEQYAGKLGTRGGKVLNAQHAEAQEGYERFAARMS